MRKLEKSFIGTEQQSFHVKLICSAKLGDYESAANTFEEALEFAKNQDNKEAQASIEKVRF